MPAKLTQDAFLSKAKKVHGDTYDYSKVIYKNSQTKVIFICPEHGEFLQIPNHHLMGKGCMKCGWQKSKKSRILSTEDFIEKAQKVHGDTYNYSKAIYTRSRESIIIICPRHGEFSQLPNNHLSGNGCPSCRNENLHNARLKPLAVFIEEARRVHQDKYDYSLSNYTKNNIPVIVKCKKHGAFKQAPVSHLRGRGCPKCIGGTSKGESELAQFLRDSKPHIKIIQNSRQIIAPQELDIYLPEYKLAIEYCGLYWHSAQYRPRNYHSNKLKACLAKGIKLITIFENEWLTKRPIVESKIKNLLGLSSKIAARKLAYMELTQKEAKAFFDTCHLQGHRNATHYVGLVDERRNIYMVMSIGKSRYSKKAEWEIIRLASQLDWHVIGGASKLFTHFINQYRPPSIVSYSDLRWGTGEQLYPNLGFQLSHRASPNYFYFNNRTGPLYSRVQFQKHKLSGKLEFFDPLKSELENMSLNGWARIHDCGNNVFTWMPPA